MTVRFDAILAVLDEQIATLDHEITTALHDGVWAASAMLLLLIPGIGIQAAAWLLVTTLNFTLCDTAEALVSYAGLSPLEHESGTSLRGRPHIGRGGNARLRTVPYMATLSASRYNPMIQAFYVWRTQHSSAAALMGCVLSAIADP